MRPFNAAPAFIIYLRPYKLHSDRKKKQPCSRCQCSGVASTALCAVSRQQVSRKRIIMSKLWICIYCQGISQFCLALCPRNLSGINILRTSRWETQWGTGCNCCTAVVSQLSPGGGVGTWGKCRASWAGQGSHTSLRLWMLAAIWAFQNLCISRLTGTLQVSNVSLPISGLVSHNFLITF